MATNPYAAIVAKYAAEGHQKQVAASMAKTDQDIANQDTGILGTLKTYAKELPGALVQVGKEAVTHPINTAASVVGGALDVGPQIVNVVRKVLFGGRGVDLPKPGQTFNELIGNDSQIQEAIRSASETTAGYEIGGAVLKPFGVPAVVQRVGGNVIGGQITTEADNAGDRAKQALFDATFGVATEAGSAGLSKALKRQRVKIPGTNAALEEVPTQTIGPKPIASTPEPQVAYVPKKNLGVDASGQKVLGRTEVDAKTGNAIIYFDQSLETNPQLKQQVIDHEIGHVFDKRVNRGTNLSAELPNYAGNKANLDDVLGSYAARTGETPEQIATKLSTDIRTLSEGNGSNAAEEFANAVSAYRKDPVKARETAPTFAGFMEHKPIEPRFSEHTTTAATLQKPAGTIEAPIRPAEPRALPAKAPTAESGLISSTGLKTGKTVKGKASFNPKSINAPEDTEALFSQLGSENRQFTAQRISKGNEDIKDLARLTGLKEEDLIKAKPGSIANAETVTAARQIVLDKAQGLLDYLKGVDMTVATPAQLQEVRDRFLKLVSMQKAVAGFRTEASNVFRSLGIALQPGENATLTELGKVLKQAGVASEGDVALFASRVAKEMHLTTAQKIGQGALSTWYASILSGPKTTARNILSTGSNIVTELFAKMANPRQWKEVPASVTGLLRGLKEGWGEAKDVLSGGAASTKFMETGGATKPEVFTGKWKTYGQVVESVGRFLNAQDKFLSAGAREMESAALKATTPELSDALSEALSKSYAETTVYHGVPKGRLVGALRDSAQALRRKFPESKVIIPFVDTVANVLDRQFDYIPVFSALRLRTSVLEQQADRIIKDFGLAAADKAAIVSRLRDQQIGRLVLGTAIAGAAVGLAKDGNVSGSGPTNTNERAQLERTGWRPNSIKLGDTWIPYTYLGPLAGIFSMAGNVHDKTRYDQSPTKTVYDLIAKGMVGWTQTQLDQSFLSGAADLLDAVSGGMDPKTYLTNLGTGLVSPPAIYSQTKDMVLRQQFETRGFVDKIRQRLGLTGSAFGMNPLEPKLDAFGEPMTSDLIYGLTPSKAKGDQVDTFLIANDIVVSKPSKGQRYSVPGSDTQRELTPEEYTKYVQESGKQIYESIHSELPFLDGLTKEEKKKAIEQIVSGIREDVRAEILSPTE